MRFPGAGLAAGIGDVPLPGDPVMRSDCRSLPRRAGAAYRRHMSGTTDQTFIEAWRERQLRNEQAAARWREARLVEAGRAARRLTSLEA